MAMPRYTVWGVTGLPEIGPGDDLVALIGAAIQTSIAEDPDAALRDGDILVVTSKIVSKAEGMQVPVADREKARYRTTVAREDPCMGVGLEARRGTDVTGIDTHSVKG